MLHVNHLWELKGLFLHVNHLWELKGLFLHVTQYCNCTCSSTLLIVLSDLYLILYQKEII